MSVLQTQNILCNMASLNTLNTLLYLGICWSAGIITTADGNMAPTPDNVRWVSRDFKTILTWTATPSNYTFTVRFSEDDSNWRESPDCIQVSDSECDLTHELVPRNRLYTADIQTESPDYEYGHDLEELPHTYSPAFNPYTGSELSALEFSMQTVNANTVKLTINDTLTGIHERGKQLTIRDILRNDLKYKIGYVKFGNTRKKEMESDSSTVEVSGLDAGQRYCFMVAPYVPSRPKQTRQGPWSIQQCLPSTEPDVNMGPLIGGIVILLIALIVIVTATFLCCRCCKKRNKTLQPSQSSRVV